MSDYGRSHELPTYLREWQEKIEGRARTTGLDFFPQVFEVLSFDEMNEVAAYGGLPTRYPHWRWGMEYERLKKSSDYGLSRIYEMVINNNPSVAYLLEGNSLVDQKLVMCHVCGHNDFFKNNFTFKITDQDRRPPGTAEDLVVSRKDRVPTRKWVDTFANHAARVRKHMDRHGVTAVEEFIDVCLALDNLIDPPGRMLEGRAVAVAPEEPETQEVPKLKAKSYMDSFINPEEYVTAQRKKMEEEAAKAKRVPEKPQRDVLKFLIEHAPLERWERDVLEIIREEAYYFWPQAQTKIMNEGWASYWHSKLMTEFALDGDELVDYADRNASVLSSGGGRSLNPYKLGIELYRSIEERWNKGQFGKEWEDCDTMEERRHWDRRLGLGRKKIFEVRALYNDVTFIDEFLTPEFCIEHKMFTYAWSNRNDRFEIDAREFKAIKDKLLFRLTNFGNPFIFVDDGNHENRAELLLRHDHQGADLDVEKARETLRCLHRVWKRPASILTLIDGRPNTLRYDGKDHTTRPGHK